MCGRPFVFKYASFSGGPASPHTPSLGWALCQPVGTAPGPGDSSRASSGQSACCTKLHLLAGRASDSPASGERGPRASEWILSPPRPGFPCTRRLQAERTPLPADGGNRQPQTQPPAHAWTVSFAEATHSTGQILPLNEARPQAFDRHLLSNAVFFPPAPSELTANCCFKGPSKNAN